MARRVFFGFHYADVISFRANVVRNHNMTKDGIEDAGYWDYSLWEQGKKSGESNIKNMINRGLTNTSVTAILIGEQTYSRRWVRYEIAKSFERGNGLFGIHIHCIPDKNQYLCNQGHNPFDFLYFRYRDNSTIDLWEVVNENWQVYSDLNSISSSNVNYNFNGKREGKFSDFFGTVDWKNNNGYSNFKNWVENVAKHAKR